jgi:hypothetical protein
MIPYITKGELEKLHVRRQKKICGCSPMCKEFINISTEKEDVMLCVTDAKQFSFEMLEQLGLVTQKHAFPQSKWGWTTEQERFLIKYLKEEDCLDEKGKVKFGTYALLGEMLSKTRSAVKDKANHLRKAGRI